MEKDQENKTGEVIVEVPVPENRLFAINNLSSAVKHIAKALSQNMSVTVKNCSFVGGEPALLIKEEEGKSVKVSKKI